MNEVIKFWFEELSPRDWWVKSNELDKTIKQRFLSLHQQAIRGELFEWRLAPDGRLAEIIILDQFSRNIYRNDPRSFESDGMAIILAQECILQRDDMKVDIEKRRFLYMPFMHSESLMIHEQALKLFNQPGLENNLEFELAHKKIIERFGRYPHRNIILGRVSTQEEEEFLKEPGSSF